MKRIYAFAAMLALMVGCANPEVTAYRAVGVTAVVDGAMNGWGDYVRAGKASDKEQTAVKSAYEKYQKAMAIAKTAAITIKTAPDGEKAFDTALRTADLAAGEIIALVRVLIKQ